MRTASVLVSVLTGVFVAAACGGDKSAVVVGPGSGGTGSGATGAGASAAVGGSFNPAGGTGNNSGGSSSGGSSATGGLDSDAACVATGADGTATQVDLYFMVDITGSMNCPVPEDPNMAACEVDPGAPYSPTTRWTTEKTVLQTFFDSPANAGLGVGIRFFPDQADICNATVYQTPLVPIAPLPGSQGALDGALAQTPGGNTPTVPSIQGALAYAQSYATANPTHKVAVVYSTDGYPKGCTNNTIDNAAAAAAAALAGSPSIPTYVLGLGRNVADLNKIAASGGTMQAYLIDTTGDAAAQLTAALASIRTKTQVGCEYTIPPPPQGQTFEPGKVNVQYTDGAGTVHDVLQDNQMPCADGWQYSADMKQINLCGTICDTIKADTGGKLTVLFGCATMGPK